MTARSFDSAVTFMHEFNLTSFVKPQPPEWNRGDIIDTIVTRLILDQINLHQCAPAQS